tara:strand:- start:665 stop:1045 length:381 start_codon:yes stop_codon:yes gene_type:complete
MVKSKAPPGGEKKKVQSKASRAGLEFSVSRVTRNMRNEAGKLRVAADGPVYATAVLEYVAVELLETAGKATLDAKRKRINTGDLSKAVRADVELNQLVGGASLFASDKVGGVAQAVATKKAEKAEK